MAIMTPRRRTARELQLLLKTGSIAASTVIAALWSTAQAADTAPADGKRLFVNCEACHTLDKDGDNGVGPNLSGLFGARAAAKPDFTYSAALKSAQIVWNETSLDRWLAGPAAYVPGTQMAFVGLSNPADRKALIAYLKVMTADH